MKTPKKILLPLYYKKKSRRALSKKQKKLIKINLKKFLFDKEKVKKSENILEIGFGYGENLVNFSINNPEKLIIGCEVYEPGIANLINKLESKKINNVIIYPENIFYLFDKLKKNSIDQIFVLFPDPWPKKKHFKRRIVSQIFLEKIYKVLKKNGLILISTDSVNYLESILINFFINKNFIWHDKKVIDCYKRPKELIESKFERKATIKGNKKYFLKFKKKC